jgi:biotin carboxyl carrier protein
MKTRIEEIYSSYEGKVEEIFVNESSYVYEWEKLMMIRKSNGELEKVAVGISGNIRLVNVVAGQQINTDTLLVKLEDDLLITGCE